MKNTNYFIIAIIVFGALFAVNGLILASWTGPIQDPPGGNTDAPLNVGSTSQYKAGALGVGGAFNGYGTIRSTGSGSPSSGTGLEMYYYTFGGYPEGGYLTSYDRTNGQTKPLHLHGSSITLNGDVSIGNRTNCEKLYTDGSGNVLCGIDATGGTGGESLWFKSTGQRIYYNGFVGIGTNNPAYQLDVAGHARFGGNIRSTVFYDIDDTGYYVDPAGTSKFKVFNATVFYDLDNTDYYVDPAGTSKFNTINLGGVSRSDWPDNSFTYTEYSNQTPYGTLTKDLGAHKFCSLSGWEGPGGLDCICRVYKSGSNWYLYNHDGGLDEQTNKCWAMCFD